MEKLNISREIYKRLTYIGVAIDDKHQIILLSNFMDKGFETLFGKLEFEEREYELVVRKNCIELTFLGNDEKYLVSKEDNNLVVSNVTNQENVTLPIVITFVDNNVKLTVTTKSDLTEYSAEYDKDKYQLTKMDSEGNITYQAYLTALNAKYRDTEVFEITRVIPEEVKESSFLKRLIDGLNNGIFINVRTSVDIYDTPVYSTEIFEELEKDVVKTKAKQLKKPTEE